MCPSYDESTSLPPSPCRRAAGRSSRDERARAITHKSSPATIHQAGEPLRRRVDSYRLHRVASYEQEPVANPTVGIFQTTCDSIG